MSSETKQKRDRIAAISDKQLKVMMSSFLSISKKVFFFLFDTQYHTLYFPQVWQEVISEQKKPPEASLVHS